MNGNDLLEYEENNVENLFESFTKKYSDEWKDFNISLPQHFIEKHPDKWAQHVQEEYDNNQSYKADLLEDVIDE